MCAICDVIATGISENCQFDQTTLACLVGRQYHVRPVTSFRLMPGTALA